MEESFKNLLYDAIKSKFPDQDWMNVANFLMKKLILLKVLAQDSA